MAKKTPGKSDTIQGGTPPREVPAREPVRAYVLLRPCEPAQESTAAGAAQGKSIFIAGAAEDCVSREVRTRLAKHGFRVTGVSPMAITVEADEGVFREVFGSPLIGSRQPPAAKGLELQVPGTVWRFKEPKQIPPNLASLVQDVIFPSTAAIHSHD